MHWNQLLIELPRWAETFFQSQWTYVVIASVFACILVIALWRLIHKPSSKSNFPGGPIHEDELADRVLALKGVPRKVLLAAAGLDCMPVTIPIRMAINLAKKKSCLLIDLDTKRDAVARAFNIPSKNPPSFEPTPTDVENIHVIAAHVFANSQIMNIQAIVRAAEKKNYEVILLSAPYLDGHPDRSQIAAPADYAILFARTAAQLKRLEAVCQKADCKIIGRYQTSRPATDTPA